MIGGWIGPGRASAAPAAAARADELAPTAASLRALAEDLRAADAEAREAAIDALATLPAGALPAIEERFRAMRREPLRGEDGYEIWRAFAHAVGSQDASEPVDVVPGIAPVLDQGVTTARARMAERLLLLRSLERIGSARAMVIALELFTFDFEAFRWEARHVVGRVGRPAAAALLRAVNAPGSLGAWGRWGLRALGIEGPAQMVQGQDEGGIAEIVRAYAAIRHMGGMPMVADYVDDPREAVRGAAREAMEAYGQNGIWQLRRVMKQQLGVEANLDWSWQLTMQRLYQALDARRLAPMNGALDAALGEAAAGRLDEAVATLGRVLERAPMLPRRAEMAPVFAAFGDARLEAERFEEARAAYDRALWLGGADPDAARWRASRALAAAEASIAFGAPDEAGLRAALASPLARARAEERLDGGAAPPAPEAATGPRLPALPLALCGLALLLGPWLLRLGRLTGGWARRATTPRLRALHRLGVEMRARRRTRARSWTAVASSAVAGVAMRARRRTPEAPTTIDDEPDASAEPQIPPSNAERPKPAPRAELPIELLLGAPRAASSSRRAPDPLPALDAATPRPATAAPRSLSGGPSPESASPPDPALPSSLHRPPAPRRKSNTGRARDRGARAPASLPVDLFLGHRAAAARHVAAHKPADASTTSPGTLSAPEA
jgi:hypothetical protein